MLRFNLVLLAGLWAGGHSAAASWADALFVQHDNDFGSVPRGPVLMHSFRVCNNTGTTVHVSQLRVSCGCTIARMEHSELAPGQCSAVFAEMHTDRFVGDKTVMIYVLFDRPEYQEVALRVHASSCDEIQITPDTLSFGRGYHSGGMKAQVLVSFPDRNRWQILNISSASTYLHASAQPVAMATGETAYRVTAALDENLPVGRWFSEIYLQTNHPRLQRVRVPVTVDIEPAVSVSPTSLKLAVSQDTPLVQRKVLVHGGQPFAIVAVRGADARWSIQDATPGRVAQHVLTVTLDNRVPGPTERAFQVITDLPAAPPVEFRVRIEGNH